VREVVAVMEMEIVTVVEMVMVMEMEIINNFILD
jgi:hypothetical protein